MDSRASLTVYDPDFFKCIQHRHDIGMTTKGMATGQQRHDEKCYGNAGHANRAPARDRRVMSQRHALDQLRGRGSVK